MFSRLEEKRYPEQVPILVDLGALLTSDLAQVGDQTHQRPVILLAQAHQVTEGWASRLDEGRSPEILGRRLHGPA